MNILSLILFVVVLCFGTVVADSPHQNTASATDTTQTLDRRFASVNEAAKAIWLEHGKSGSPTCFTFGPVPGENNSYIVYYVTPDFRFFYGTASITADGDYYTVPPLGYCFFYKSGEAEGTFNLCLYSPECVAMYFTGMRPGVTPVFAQIIDPRISMLGWAWEIKASDGKVYHILVYDHHGTAKIFDTADWEQLRKDRTVKVDKVEE